MTGSRASAATVMVTCTMHEDMNFVSRTCSCARRMTEGSRPAASLTSCHAAKLISVLMR
jgi:hypothetical protein